MGIAISALSRPQLLRKNFQFYRIHDNNWLINTHLPKLNDTADLWFDIYSPGAILYKTICGKIREKCLLFKTLYLADSDTPSFGSWMKLSFNLRPKAKENN
jgi:hypothetical protein